MLHVQHVARHFPTRSGPLVVLRDCSFELSAGENVVILGPSGSGKSTLLYIVGTLDAPTSGTVTLDGQDPFTLDERRLAEFRNRRIGFVFQDHHLLPQLSVLENVLVPYRLEENKELLKGRGFRHVDQFFKWYNFCGMIAMK